MPELPEVQALAAFVEQKARGRRIADVQLVSFAALKTADPAPSALVGRTVTGAGRRGKFLLIETKVAGDGGTARGGDAGRAPAPDEGLDGRDAGLRQGARAGNEPDRDARAVDTLWLAVHFWRAGWLRWHDAPAPQPSAKRRTAPAEADAGLRAVPPAASRPRPRGGPIAMRVTLDDRSGFDLTEAGTQKRLAIHVVRSPEEVPGIARLGIDALDPAFDSAALARMLHGRTAQLKHLLADQSLIAGVGNAYSDEALHAARLSPFRPAGNLSAEEVERLHEALLGVLRDGLRRNEGVPASELKDEKRSGMRVHGRTGLPCPVCGDAVREVAFSDRSLQYCPTCQTGGKPLADRRLSRLLR